MTLDSRLLLQAQLFPWLNPVMEITVNRAPDRFIY
jgi:hypothetical protein